MDIKRYIIDTFINNRFCEYLYIKIAGYLFNDSLLEYALIWSLTYEYIFAAEEWKLIKAARDNHILEVQKILQNHCPRKDHLKLAFHYAIQNQHIDMVTLLLEYDAELKVQNEDIYRRIAWD